jgi:hypothetical protein
MMLGMCSHHTSDEVSDRIGFSPVGCTQAQLLFNTACRADWITYSSLLHALVCIVMHGIHQTN